MAQVLIVDTREDFSKKLKVALHRYLNLLSVIKDNPQDATEVIDLLANLKLVLVQANTKHENFLTVIKNYLSHKSRYMQVISYSTEENLTYILKKITNELMLDTKIDNIDESAAIDDIYIPVEIDLLKKLTIAPCDLFIKIGTGTAAHFVKRLKQMDGIDVEFLNKLKQNSISEIHLKIEDHDHFMTALTNSMVDGMTKPGTNIEFRLKYQAEAFDYLQKISKLLEFDSHFMEVLDNSIESVTSSLRKERPLSNLIGQLIGRKDGLAFQSYYLTNLISLHLLSRVGLDSDQNLQAIIYASLFCDLGIESDDQLFVNSQADLDAISRAISAENIHHLYHHAKINSDRAKKIPNISKQVQKIILEHHGSPVGVGFCDDKGSEIGDLSRIFLISNTFIKYFLNPIFSFDKKLIVTSMVDRFKDPFYRELIKHLAVKIE
jgi:hypothetical protein